MHAERGSIEIMEFYVSIELATFSRRNQSLAAAVAYVLPNLQIKIFVSHQQLNPIQSNWLICCYLKMEVHDFN